MRPLRWQPATTLVLTVFGLGVATYLTITHFDTHVSLSCPAGGGFINCEKVTTSPQSYVFGIPVAVLGLAFFVPMLLLCTPMAWRAGRRWVHWARLALSISGVGMIIYLISAELFIIKSLCMWCTSVHVVTFFLFVIIAPATPYALAAAGTWDGGAQDPDGGNDADGSRAGPVSTGAHRADDPA
ncbi:MAG: vitamin K epoxide reductase family protein [Actinomycetota bacterium]|nr:vitamin K epoxide reductase family protein [Actinomycetota bacterium]